MRHHHRCLFIIIFHRICNVNEQNVSTLYLFNAWHIYLVLSVSLDFLLEPLQSHSYLHAHAFRSKQITDNASVTKFQLNTEIKLKGCAEKMSKYFNEDDSLVSPVRSFSHSFSAFFMSQLQTFLKRRNLHITIFLNRCSKTNRSGMNC